MTDLKRLLDEATPLPWHVKTLYFGGPEVWAGPDPEHESGYRGVTERVPLDADAALIVAAVNALPDLLAAVEALERLLSGYDRLQAGLPYIGTKDARDARAVLRRLREAVPS